MKLNILYNTVLRQLDDNSIENSVFEAKELIKHFYKLSESDFLLRRNDDFSDVICQALQTAVDRRLNGEPLQYIIGEWDFMGYTFSVGDGVLIPRPETELLCEFVIESILSLQSPVVYDLCSGSGCIGISVKKAVPSAEVYLVEKSDLAYKYLKKNVIKLCGENQVNTVNADIFNFDMFKNNQKADVIVSNPPYIRSSEIPTLQAEVQQEPVMALDGGEDGLEFYRFIITEWRQLLKDNGFFAFECGEDQAGDIAQILDNYGFDSFTLKDYNNIDRIVIGRRKC